jgi:hypothetical protein
LEKSAFEGVFGCDFFIRKSGKQEWEKKLAVGATFLTEEFDCGCGVGTFNV